MIAYWIFNYQCNLKMLTSTPDPRMPPKYHTCSVMCSLSTDFPPGKKSRILHSTQTTDRGSRLIPRHFAKPPEHILTPMSQLIINPGVRGAPLQLVLQKGQELKNSDEPVSRVQKGKVSIQSLSPLIRSTVKKTTWSVTVAANLFAPFCLLSPTSEASLPHMSCI